ncbi:MAG TPA: trehalase family glycosidase [Terriglobia bacterium]|nr:trehalase family glycosidase [Terriglobia bacterium]
MRYKCRVSRFVVAALLSLSLPLFAGQAPKANTSSSRQGYSDILQYISAAWPALTRTMTSCRTVTDPKAPAKSILYFPADFRVPSEEQSLAKNCSVRLEHLPVVITKLGEFNAGKIEPHGLLYLPHPYVVPGGMFNEMYGWDSYFIIRGLLEAGKTDLARGIVENFFFEIDHYGGFLNANRGYVLERSQPPFLTSMVRAVYDAEKAGGREDKAFLEAAYPHAVKDYELWVHEPHLAGDTGLSRYYAFGEGPVPELGAESSSYYRGVARYFLMHPAEAGQFFARGDASPTEKPMGPSFSLFVCDSGSNTAATKGCDDAGRVSLTREFYEGDRSVRESGFDISFRFGPFGAATHHFAAVDLNSLLYKVETDLEWMSEQLGKNDESLQWAERAEKRRAAVMKYLWNAERGLFFDYDFTTGAQSSYVYATAFYPLWTGLATPEQAKAVAENLKLFEHSGGLVMSERETSAQWDYPYGWAPVELIAIEGLRRYGFNDAANQCSFDFLSDVLKNFRRDGTIREKYNVVASSSETKVTIGYAKNQIGFGWTNGAFLVLLNALPEEWKSKLAEIKEEKGAEK